MGGTARRNAHHHAAREDITYSSSFIYHRYFQQLKYERIMKNLMQFAIALSLLLTIASCSSDDPNIVNGVASLDFSPNDMILTSDGQDFVADISCPEKFRNWQRWLVFGMRVNGEEIFEDNVDGILSHDESYDEMNKVWQYGDIIVSREGGGAKIKVHLGKNDGETRRLQIYLTPLFADPGGTLTITQQGKNGE